MERRLEEFDEKVAYFAKHCKHYLTSIDLSSQWQTFKDQIIFDVDSRVETVNKKISFDKEMFADKKTMYE